MIKSNIQAVIFDMDGVISDTQTAGASIEAELFKNHGIDMNPYEITRRFAGRQDYDMFKEVFSDVGKELPNLDGLVEEKWDKMTSYVCANVKAVPGTKEFISTLKQHNMPIAVASASPLSFIKLVLQELKLENIFNAIASSEEVTKGKPAPDVFLLAAKRLNILPEHCLVIEDGISGMIGAKSAGMRCIALVRNLPEGEYPAELIVDDLRKVPLEKYFNF